MKPAQESLGRPRRQGTTIGGPRHGAVSRVMEFGAFSELNPELKA